MSVGISPVTPFNETAYVTVAEYINAPTAIDYNNLVSGGNELAQQAELFNVISRASSFMNEYLNQSLNASVITETQRTRMTPQGYLAVHPSNDPVISLSNFQYGANPNQLVTLSDCSQAWFEEQQIIIPVSQFPASSVGALSFAGAAPSRVQIFCKYTYVAGYVNTFINTATAGQSTLTVTDASGILANGIYRISDGAGSETITVASSYTYGSTTVPLVTGLAYSHANGVAIGNLPTTIKQACILVTTAFLKVRGDSSMTMQMTSSPSRNANNAVNLYGSEMATAVAMLDLYRRVR